MRSSFIDCIGNQASLYLQKRAGNFSKKNESVAEFLKRQQRRYPFNTFTIMNYPDSYEVGRTYVMLCNTATFITYKQFMDGLKGPEAMFQPKLVCSDNDKPTLRGMMDK